MTYETFSAFIILVAAYTGCTGVPKQLVCGGYYQGCCPDSFWNNRTQLCEPCMPGYNEANCSKPCPYPYYGKHCQEKCTCIKDFCDFTSGCQHVTRDKTTTSGKSYLAVDNDTLSTESSTYYNNKKLESSSINDALLLYIKIFGVVDIFLSFLYIGACMYDRQIRSNRVTNTCVIMPEKNSSYENVDVVFSSEQASTSRIL